MSGLTGDQATLGNIYEGSLLGQSRHVDVRRHVVDIPATAWRAGPEPGGPADSGEGVGTTVLVTRVRLGG
ncbi:hypothetical protein AB0D71_25440 [Streptomyces avermitilis]|uniref:hypothetical protein n=1 Tax=Streptomyces avermitilis TaxID=33903 RepID=UPI0033E6DF15